jgi:hypothetical protein
MWNMSYKQTENDSRSGPSYNPIYTGHFKLHILENIYKLMQGEVKWQK